MQLQGLAVAVLSSSTGKIRKGMNTFNFGETVEKATPQSQTSNFYRLQQMQFNRALKHIEGMQSDQHSKLRTDIETLCSESTKLIDPWFSSEFMGCHAIYTGLSSLSRIFKDRAYDVMGSTFKQLENGNR